MGSDSLALDAFRRGADGAVSALANAAPPLFVEMKRAVVEGRDHAATAAQEEVVRIRRLLARGPLLAG
jgi:dihydrodipicolinate synthase/N-acetylneuraminate lyase